MEPPVDRCWTQSPPSSREFLHTLPTQIITQEVKRMHTLPTQIITQEVQEKEENDATKAFVIIASDYSTSSLSIN